MAADDVDALAVQMRDTSIFDTGSSPVSKHVNAESCREGLRESGARRELAELLRADAMIDLTDWIAAALAQGLAKVEIARLSGLSRPTVDALSARSADRSRTSDSAKS